MIFALFHGLVYIFHTYFSWALLIQSIWGMGFLHVMKECCLFLVVAQKSKYSHLDLQFAHEYAHMQKNTTFLPLLISFIKKKITESF